MGSGENTLGYKAENFLVANNIVVSNPRGISEENNTGINRFISNLVWNNATNWVLLTSSQQSSLSEDPRFVNFKADGSGDYRLRNDSPAIDRGVGEAAPSFDFLGYPRIMGLAPDLGPLEIR